MFWQVGPCGPTSDLVHVANALLNAVTLVLCAWLTTRARRRDRKEGNGDHNAR